MNIFLCLGLIQLLYFYLKHRMAKSHLPIQTLSHQKEAISRTKFSQIIHPWIARDWQESDYGIDVCVELTVPNFSLSSKRDRNVTAKYFNVQLKASEVSKGGKKGRTFSVPIQKINYWLGSNLPTLLCLFDTNDETFHYRWIDKKLVDELDENNSRWTTQEKVSVLLLPNFEKAFSKIEKYVFDKKRPLIHGIKAGDYFAFNKEIVAFLNLIEKEASKFDDDYLKKELKSIKDDLSRAVYNITIAGESRVGKSSLMNALIGKKVSPVGIFPTTGVPICAMPSSKENCIIRFKKGRDKKGKIDAKFVRTYVDQKQNPNNDKGVELVVLNVINQSLENGIALYDIPGLNDADPNIRVISDTILNKSNAVIYLISAAPMKDGEFILTKNMVETLQKLKRDSDRVFLVLSKADKLNKKNLNDLEKYLTFELNKYDIIFDEKEPFTFISTQDKFQNKRIIYSPNDLQKIIWDFLLSNEKSGIQRLFGGVNNILSILEKILSINTIRLSDTTEVEKWRIDFEGVKEDLKDQKSKIRLYAKELRSHINKKLEEDKALIINHLETYLRKVSPNHALYSEIAINDYIEQSANNTAKWVEEAYHTKMEEIENDYNKWIRERLILTSDNSQDSNTEQNTYDDLTWDIKTLLSAKPSNNIILYLLSSAGEIIQGVGELIEAIFKGKEIKREEQIVKICNSSRKKINKIFKSFDKKIASKFNSSAKEIFERINYKTDVYLGKIEESLSKSNSPLNSKEIEELEEFSLSLTELKKNAKSLKTRIGEKMPFSPE